MSYPYFDPTIAYAGVGEDDPGLRLLAGEGKFIGDDEQKILQKLRSKLLAYSKPNEAKRSYYGAAQIVEHLEIGVPANLREIGVAVGWAGTTVDALDERIDWLGWHHASGDLRGLDWAYVDNNLGVESNLGHIESLCVGTAFATVGRNADDPKVSQINIESASSATVLWDYHRRRSTAGLSQTVDDDGNVVLETLYLDDVRLTLERDGADGLWEVTERNDHGLGRCLMTRLPNRASAAQREGRSEITRAVRYLTDAAVRTLLGMEVNREFYVAPQRFVLNARPEDFGVTKEMTAQERYLRGLSLAMGMINIVPGRKDNSEGDPVSVQEFKPSPPTPFIEQVKAYSIQMSAETGLPADTFGFVTDNPTSGDAIVKSDFRVARRAARRIGSFAGAYKEVGLLTQLALGKPVDTDWMRGLTCRFASPLMPTPAATADELQKMIASGVLVPDSNVTYELYGRLDDRMVEQLERDKVKFEAKQQRKALQAATLAAAANPQPDGARPPGGQRPPTGEPQQSTARPARDSE